MISHPSNYQVYGLIKSEVVVDTHLCRGLTSQRESNVRSRRLVLVEICFLRGERMRPGHAEKTQGNIKIDNFIVTAQ